MDEQQTPAEPPAMEPPPMEPPPAMTPPPASSWEAAPAAAPAPVPGAAGFVYADVPNRVFALIIDAVILLVAYIVVGIVLAAIGLSTGGLAGAVVFNPVATLVFAVVLSAINIVYFVWSWTTMRATFGMRALGMQVGNAFDGKTLTRDQAVRRAVALWGPSTAAQFLQGISGIGSIIGLLAFLWTLYLLYTTAKSPTKQGFHDTFANTVVVKASRSV